MKYLVIVRVKLPNGSIATHVQSESNDLYLLRCIVRTMTNERNVDIAEFYKKDRDGRQWIGIDASGEIENGKVLE